MKKANHLRKSKLFTKKRKFIGAASAISPKSLINSLSGNGLPLTEEASMKINCSTIEECNDRMNGIREAIQHILVIINSDRKTKKKINIPLYFGEKINDEFTGIRSLKNNLHKRSPKYKHLNFEHLHHLDANAFSKKVKEFSQKVKRSS